MVHDAYVLAFQSTHPVRGGTTLRVRGCIIKMLFQSTHPVRGGTVTSPLEKHRVKISIHPPREGWDFFVPNRLVWEH